MVRFGRELSFWPADNQFLAVSSHVLSFVRGEREISLSLLSTTELGVYTLNVYNLICLEIGMQPSNYHHNLYYQ